MAYVTALWRRTLGVVLDGQQRTRVMDVGPHSHPLSVAVHLKRDSNLYNVRTWVPTVNDTKCLWISASHMVHSCALLTSLSTSHRMYVKNEHDSGEDGYRISWRNCGLKWTHFHRELLGFRTPSIVRILNRRKTRRFGNWICFLPQVREDTYSVGSLRKS
jgi:hypothetical protein